MPQYHNPSRTQLTWFSLLQGHTVPRTHFKGLKPSLLLDVFHALITLLLEVLSLLLIQQANVVQECGIAPYDLRRKEKCRRHGERKSEVRGAHLLGEVTLCHLSVSHTQTNTQCTQCTHLPQTYTHHTHAQNTHTNITRTRMRAPRSHSHPNEADGVS